MLCQVCRDALEGMWRPENRLARVDEYLSGEDLDEYTAVIEYFASRGLTEELHEVDNYIYGHHKDIESLSRSARQGCLICNPLSSDEGLLTNIDLGYYTVFSVSTWASGMRMRFDRSWFFTFMPEKDGSFDKELNFTINASTESDQAWSMVKQWFKTCTESHDKCKTLSASGAYMPTRVLELTQSHHGHFFRLVDGSRCPKGSRYITLSHCWGKETVKPSLKLLGSTVRYLSQQQPVATLPKTFRDAMVICGRFDIKYLWIDRLCIYQDSADDWQKEAASMQKVYRNGLISISALGAGNSEEGLFFNRDPAAISPSLIDIRLRVDRNPKQFMCRDEREHGWRSSFENEPLLQRGWILQERLLAPRVLHFGTKQLFWECRQARCCETHPKRLYTENCGWHTWPGGTHLWKKLVGDLTLSLRVNPLDHAYDEWDSVVRVYTGCKLTKPSDKLVALSGLANDMRLRLQSLQPGEHKYLAGLWEARLHHSLCWTLRKPAERPEKYRAPSWSWASLDMKPMALKFREHSRNVIRYCDIDHAEIETVVGGLDTGAVTGGSILLSGAMATLQLGPFTGKSRQTAHIRRVLKISWDERQELVQGARKSGNGPKDGAVCFDTTEDVRDQVLVIVINDAKYTDSEDGPRLEGLALLHTEDSTYKRIGSFWLSFNRSVAPELWVHKLPRKQIKII